MKIRKQRTVQQKKKDSLLKKKGVWGRLSKLYCILKVMWKMWVS